MNRHRRQNICSNEEDEDKDEKQRLINHINYEKQTLENGLFSHISFVEGTHGIVKTHDAFSA